ncbi:hypothetical protein HYT26_00495 [Candidatus Pacearchaeota archaeon]|nr:hypothetical protein [Candidatus Pacearchaeota archaeon]
MGNSEKQSKTKKDYEFIAQIVVAAILAVLIIYSGAKFFSSGNGIGGAAISGVSASEIIPSGIPAVYGGELGVRYDDISTANPRQADATIGVLGKFDNSITLTGSDLQRYIDIGLQISCEYCCGADSIIFSNGKAACGCAHSYAMRGLAKYLIKNHGTEFTDDEILEELGKWKVLFFPGIHETKAAVLKSKGIELNYINLASNKYRGIETGKQSSGSMVGGC